jgi:hypothetical protein
MLPGHVRSFVSVEYQAKKERRLLNNRHFNSEGQKCKTGHVKGRVLVGRGG